MAAHAWGRPQAEEAEHGRDQIGQLTALFEVNPPLGDDQLRARRIGFDLATQPHDLNVDGAVVDLGVVQPRQAHQLIARQHPLGGATERRQQAELTVAQVELAAVRRRQLACAQVELPAGEAVGTALVFTGPDCNPWGADGIGMDNADNLYVAANSKGQIDRVDPVGHVEVLAAGDPLSFPSDLASGTGRGDRKDIFISNFAAFPTSAGAPGVLDMNVGIPGRPIG